MCCRIVEGEAPFTRFGRHDMADDLLSLGKDRGPRRLSALMRVLLAAIAAVLSATLLISHLPTQPGPHRAAHAAKAARARPATKERLDYPERPDGPVQLAGLGAAAARLLEARATHLSRVTVVTKAANAPRQRR
jgi:hypothetical protein